MVPLRPAGDDIRAFLYSAEGKLHRDHASEMFGDRRRGRSKAINGRETGLIRPGDEGRTGTPEMKGNTGEE